MFIPAIAEFFKHKVVGSVIVLVCWSSLDKVQFAKLLSQHGIKSTISCDPSVLDHITDERFQGVLLIEQEEYDILDGVQRSHFSHWYKWLVVNVGTLDSFQEVRFDADITTLITEEPTQTEISVNDTSTFLDFKPTIFFHDVYIHPRDGVSTHSWAHWTQSNGFQVAHDWDRILRRRDMKQYPFRIAAPVAHYSEETYKGPFSEYLVDMTVLDAGLRCGYGASALLIDAANASLVLLPVNYWVSLEHANGTLQLIRAGSADVSAGVLRVLEVRLNYMDYLIPIWHFHVGFTYLAERESSSNMYVEPFTAAVWWSCLMVGLILALAQRVAARSRYEKDGAFIAVLATWLQQDADAVPDGPTGRWTFTVLSICSMLVHAYYTSAIVSALMSTGRGGPKTLRELADSRYAIASEDHDFIRQTMFNVETNWPDMEYLKKKKMTSKFYQEIEYGVQLMQQGYTAYHAEYHQIYHYLDTLSDIEICKMQYVDTIPENMAWVATTYRGQYTEILRTAGAWIFETGLAKRLIHRIRLKPPQCRISLLAERVTFWDVAPLLALTTLGAVASLALLGVEIILAKFFDTRKIRAKNLSHSSIEGSAHNE